MQRNISPYLTLLLFSTYLFTSEPNAATPALLQNPVEMILSASQAQSSFEEATLDLEQAQYKIALQKFKHIEQSGFYSGGLFLNMAIAAVELDSLGLAKFYLQKAVEEPTTEAAANEALAYVESQFSRQAATLPPLPWETALDYIEHNWGSLWLFWSAFAFLCLSVILLLFHWFGNASNHRKKSPSKRHKPTIMKGSWISLLFFFTSLSIAMGTDYRSARYSEAVIIAQEVEVRNSPSASGEVLVMGYEGYDCRVDFSVDAIQGWRFIRLSNGQTGWVLDQTLRIH
ncbi:MAG: SH3 domain-containing protein [Bacteroidetes bacterium]|nr:SH3 domain-containing protein [Bacteroidota bacterium]